MASFAGAAMASQVSFAGVRDTTRRAGSKCATPVRVATRVSGPFTNTRKLTPLHALPNNDQAQASDADADREALDEDEDESQSSTTQSSFHRRVAAGATAFALSAVLALAPPGELMLAIAKDLVDPRAVESGKCLLSRCQLELAACVADEKCAESLVCLNSCYGRPDEADCQIKCGDLYASKAVMTFNTCAITTNDCVKQKQDTGEYAVPPLANMAEGFDATVFGEEKRWYIVAGLNPDFDLFDCQEHFFDSPDPDHMAVKINWRINRPNGQFYERSDVQTFYADAESPAIMHNNGNEYLHYQDDWYIPGFKKGEYVFVYYKGTNDAWDGYGGAVVYSTSPSLNAEYVPELTALASKVGVKWSDFRVTDNSCKPEPELRFSKIADLDTLGDDILVAEKTLGKDVRSASRVLGKDFKGLAKEVGKDARFVESLVERDVAKIEKEVAKDIASAEREVEKDLAYESKAFKDEVRAIEERFGLARTNKFTFLKTGDETANPDFDQKSQKKAEKRLGQVEKSVRKEDARTAQ